MKIKEELNKLVAKLGFQVVENENTTEPMVDSQIETDEEEKTPNEEVMTDTTNDKLEETEREKTVDEAHIKAEEQLDKEREDIVKLSEKLNNIEELLKNQNDMIEKLKMENEELKNTPVIESVNNVLIKKEDMKELSIAEKKYEFLQNLKNKK